MKAPDMRQRLDSLTEPYDPMHPPAGKFWDGVANAANWTGFAIFVVLLYLVVLGLPAGLITGLLRHLL